MLKYGIFVALLTASAPALAQDAAGAPPGAMEAKAQAFGQCIGGGIKALPATTSPEAGATAILAGCAKERAALETAFEAFVSAAPISDAEKDKARAELRTELAKAETEIAAGIRQARVAPAR